MTLHNHKVENDIFWSNAKRITNLREICGHQVWRFICLPSDRASIQREWFCDDNDQGHPKFQWCAPLISPISVVEIIIYKYILSAHHLNCGAAPRNCMSWSKRQSKVQRQQCCYCFALRARFPQILTYKVRDPGGTSKITVSSQDDEDQTIMNICGTSQYDWLQIISQHNQHIVINNLYEWF